MVEPTVCVRNSIFWLVLSVSLQYKYILFSYKFIYVVVTLSPIWYKCIFLCLNFIAIIYYNGKCQIAPKVKLNHYTDIIVTVMCDTHRYCDCFANGEFCSNCNCVNCSNNMEHEKERSKAIKVCVKVTLQVALL